MNSKTLMYQLTETSLFMMSFVIVTKQNNCIVIDGGRPEDMPLLKKYVGGRHISAWILTHAHDDHISGFVDEIEKNGGADFDIEKVYYNFPPYEWINEPDVPSRAYHEAEYNEMIPAFNAIKDRISDKLHVVEQGESIQIDECRIDFIYTVHEGLTVNPMNDASLVFKVITPNKSVIFLGDLGPDGGDWLFRESRHLLKSDIVQMAHHGHMGVGFEIYAYINPEACLWCCADWLYNEGAEVGNLGKKEYYYGRKRMRMYGTMMTREWMDMLGVKTHYVTKDGTNTIEL